MSSELCGISNDEYIAFPPYADHRVTRRVNYNLPRIIVSNRFDQYHHRPPRLI